MKGRNKARAILLIQGEGLFLNFSETHAGKIGEGYKIGKIAPGLTFHIDKRAGPGQTGRVKTRLGICLAVLCFFTGCVAIPPLINVQHKVSDDPSMKERVDELERRVRELEAKSATK